MDGARRYVLAWTRSNPPDARIGADGYRPALSVGPPDLFHPDLGAPYGRKTRLRLSKAAGVPVSRSGAGRGYDPSRIERLGHPVQHEEVYRRDYEKGRTALRAFFAFYNEERPHPALGYRPPPAEVYFGSDRSGTAPPWPTPVPLQSTRPQANP